MKMQYLFSFTRFLNKLFKLNYLKQSYPELEYYYRNRKKILEKMKIKYHKNKQ